MKKHALKIIRNIVLMLTIAMLVTTTACGNANKTAKDEASTIHSSSENSSEILESIENTAMTEVSDSSDEGTENLQIEEIENTTTTEEEEKPESTEKKEPSTIAKKEETESTTEKDADVVTYTYKDFSQTMYASGAVNVRNNPDTSGEKLGTLSANQKVEVTGQCNETKWYRINYKGTSAYVSNKYLTKEMKVERPAKNWVSKLNIAQSKNQIIVVAANGNKATVSMHTKIKEGEWKEIYSTSGRIGKNGIGKTKEGDGKTPTGVFGFNKAFGILSNPGISSMSYLKVNETHHWVDDSESKYYNKLVSTKDVEKDWDSSEHLYKISPQYNYALALDYNTSCTPYAGSAIFLHCTSDSFGTTAGCIAIPQKYMKMTMQNLKGDCVIIIDSEKRVHNY